MRPRIILLLFGFVISILSILALIKTEAIPDSIVGSAIGEKMKAIPASPIVYFLLFLALGIISIIISVVQRKVVY